MGVRTTIQARLIALFKVNEYEVVTYDSNGIPSVGADRETPSVHCNETSAAFDASQGHKGGQILSGWQFDLICDFIQEVDYSNFLLGLDNLSFTIGDDFLVEIVIGNNVIVAHPATQGSHTGTQLRFNINAKIKN